MGYEKRVWDLGRVKEVEERHTWKWNPPGKRRKKEKPTEEAVKRNNHRKMVRQRRMQLEMYFCEDDCYMTLTYPKDARPEDMKECQDDWKKLVDKLRRIYKRNDGTLRWIRNIEKGTKGAWHIHAVIKELPSGSVDRDGKPVHIAKLVQQIWQKQLKHGRVDTQYLQEDVQALAEYITKTPETSVETGHQVIESNCSASRNMPLPEPEVKEYSRWKTFQKREIKVPKGWALVKESVRESTNPYTGYPRREYRLIRLDGSGRNEVRRC